MLSPNKSRWTLLAHALLALSLPVVVTVGGRLLAQLVHGIPSWAAEAISALLGLGASAAVAAWWVNHFGNQNRALVRGIATGSLQHAERQVKALSRTVLCDIAEAWQATLMALHLAYEDKQALAAQHYATLSELMRMLGKAVDERAPFMRGHSERVAEYSELIAREMGLHPLQTERIRLAALIHDIGCLGIDDRILMKESALNAEEFDAVKAHPLKGAAILRPIEALHDLIPGVELHHEALDGSGYPYGLQSDDIPLMARIIAVADSFDAMTTWRPYQSAMDPLYTLEVLEGLVGRRYEGRVVTALDTLVRRGAIVAPDTRPFERNYPRLMLVR
jgi:HD-GYP domain-containing protein (c-di-GMP phosphodiesterase class II)